MKTKRNTSKQFAVTRRAIAAITPEATLATCIAALARLMGAGVAPLKARLTVRAAMHRAGLRLMGRGSENIFAMRTPREERRAAARQARWYRRYPMVAELDRLYKEALANNA